MSQIKSDSRIRVLRILSRMNVGGPSKHVVHLTRGLDSYDYESRLIVGLPESAEGSMLRIAEEINLRPEIIACLDRPISAWRDSIAFCEIVRHIREFRPHIVHTHTTKAGILGRIAAIICRVPVIFHTFHGHVFSGYFSERSSRGIICLERLLSRFSDRVITLSNGLKHEITQCLRISDSEKVEVIPLGLDLAKNLATPRKSSGWRSKIGLGQNIFLAGIVARLVPVKNHQMLINAVAECCRKFVDLHLAIIGGGELESQLREQVSRLGLNNRVHFCGVVREMEEVYADLDLLILSSKNEGTPVVIIEALASGCPVAATRVGGIEEVLESGRLGTLMRSDSAGFFVDLADLLAHGRIVEISESMRKATAEKYAVSSLVDRIHHLYSRLLQLRGINVK